MKLYPLFLVLLSYAGLVLIIHGLYAWGAQSVRLFLDSARGRRCFQRGSGPVFIGFGLALARSSHRAAAEQPPTLLCAGL